MNILYVAHNLGYNVPESQSTVLEGGCEKFTYGLAHGLSQEHTCYILYPDLRRKHVVNLHKVEKFRNENIIQWKHPSKFHKVSEFAKILKEYKIDAIHYQHLIHCPVEYTIIGRALGLKQILTVHDYYYICEEHFLENDKYVTCDIPADLKRCCECMYNKIKADPEQVVRRRDIMRTVLENMDRIFVPSKAVRSDYFKIFPEFNDKIKVLPIGVKPRSRVGVSVEKKGLRIAVPSYLTYIKGWVPLVNIIRMCEKSLLDVKFIIACDEIDSSQETYLRQFTNVEFGEMDESINLVWIPSIAKETFSLIVSEQIQEGRPILCANKGALAERLETGAFRYEPDSNVEQIFELIREIRNSPKLLTDMSEAMGTMSAEVPLLEQSLREYEHFYQK